MTDRVVVSESRTVDFPTVRLSSASPMQAEFNRVAKAFPRPDDTVVTIQFRAVVDADDPAYAAHIEAVEQRRNEL